MIRTLHDAVTTLRFCALIPGLEGHRKDLLAGARILEEAEIARVTAETSLLREVEMAKEKLAAVVRQGQEEIDRLSYEQNKAMLDLEAERAMHRATAEKLEIETATHRETAERLELVMGQGQAEIDRLSALLEAVTSPPAHASDGIMQAALPIVGVPEEEETSPSMKP